jgi:3-dehydroquinate synthase class II
MSENLTLVTEVHITDADGSIRMSDVGTRVERTPRRTRVVFGYARGTVVAVTVNEAERIALIEALGGVVR